MQYKLYLEEPYEYDPATTADYHELGWGEKTATFEAAGDQEAIVLAEEYVASIPPVTVDGETGRARPIRLIRVIKAWL
ncbi:MAG: hypothetical protein Q8M92_04520 [Candidatus Subteraquimicrobiales bacterium]|nr:hypothetical protein [Candidatus Subteraquimicrobiales bacterium]